LRQQNKTFIVITGAEKQLMKTLFSSSSLHSTTLLYKKNLRVHFFFVFASYNQLGIYNQLHLQFGKLWYVFISLKV